MKFGTFVSCLYGELRRYNRFAIRHRAKLAEDFDRDTLARISDARLQTHIDRSLAMYPYYAEVVRSHRGSIPRPGEKVPLEEFPVWTRRDQRAFFEQQTPPPGWSFVHQTSGSTGLPIFFRITRESYEWRTAITDRAYGWAGAEEGVPSVYVWQLDSKTRPRSHKIKRWVHLMLQRRRYFDAFQGMGDDSLAEFCEMINEMKPHSVVGYTGVIVDLARWVRDNPGRLKHRPRTMVSAAEGLQPHQRELLETHLVEEVYLGYGSREFMSVGMECEHHVGYHVNTDNVRVEVVDDDGKPMPPGETGRIVITDMHNAGTPFIRYEIGDVGTLAAPDERCKCGRPFPLLTSVDGRLLDVVRRPNGERVTAIFITYSMRQFPWVEGWQIVQPTLDEITIRLLTPLELTPERIAPVEQLLRTILGDEMKITFERADELSRRRSGKVHLIISSVNDPDG